MPVVTARIRFGSPDAGRHPSGATFPDDRRRWEPRDRRQCPLSVGGIATMQGASRRLGHRGSRARVKARPQSAPRTNGEERGRAGHFGAVGVAFALLEDGELDALRRWKSVQRNIESERCGVTVLRSWLMRATVLNALMLVWVVGCGGSTSYGDTSQAAGGSGGADGSGGGTGDPATGGSSGVTSVGGSAGV
jgi:hypothetical protein